MKLQWLGKATVGSSGFRFVRIDNVDASIPVELSQVGANLTLRDVPHIGSFKRDHLVWLGDMHPEVSVINSVFGYNEVVPNSVDMTRDVTPVSEWMNGISSYSMWWILIHEESYLHHGKLDYLKL